MTSESSQAHDELAAHALIDAMHAFAATLDARQRALLAALLAPGIAGAWLDDDGEPEGAVHWSPDRLPRHLVAAIRANDLRIVSGDLDDGADGVDGRS